MSSTVLGSRQFCTFKVEDLTFGIDVARVQEIIRYQELTPVPLAPPCVRGLMNLRGNIVTAIDLRSRLGLPPLQGPKPPTNVVVRGEGCAVSFLVDRIGDVMDMPGRPGEPPRTLRGEAAELVEGVFQLEGGLLLVLDVEAAMEVG